MIIPCSALQWPGQEQKTNIAQIENGLTSVYRLYTKIAKAPKYVSMYSMNSK